MGRCREEGGRLYERNQHGLPGIGDMKLSYEST
jgi:hypothetical protein